MASCYTGFLWRTSNSTDLCQPSPVHCEACLAAGKVLILSFWTGLKELEVLCGEYRASKPMPWVAQLDINAVILCQFSLPAAVAGPSVPLPATCRCNQYRHRPLLCSLSRRLPFSPADIFSAQNHEFDFQYFAWMPKIPILGCTVMIAPNNIIQNIERCLIWTNSCTMHTVESGVET